MKSTTRRFSSFIVPALAVAAMAVFVGDAEAGTETSNLSVTATIAANCTISTSTVAFGTYDPIVTHASSPLDSTGTVTVTCTNGSGTTITLGQGSNADTGSTDTAPVRRMLSGANYLSYSLFQDTSREVVWGNTAPTGKSHTGTGLSTDLTVYGRVGAGQNVPTGSYADTVVATVTF